MGGRRAGEEVNPPPHPFTQHLLPYPPPKDTLTPEPEGEEEAVGPQTTQRDGDRQTVRYKTDRPRGDGEQTEGITRK